MKLTKQEIADYENKIGKKIEINEEFEELVRCERHPKVIYIKTWLVFGTQCPKCITLKTLDDRQNYGWDKEQAKGFDPDECDICGRQEVLVNGVWGGGPEGPELNYVYCYKCRKH